MTMHAKDDPRLFRFLDGFHHSLALLQIQYADLCSVQARLTPEDQDLIMRGMSLAWSIVDSVHRVRELAEALPGFKGNDQERRDFLAATSIAEDFRHYIQHLRGELSKPTIDNFPVWGSFNWVDPKDDKQCHLAVMGTLVGNISLQSCIFDRLENRWVSKIALSIKGQSFNVDPIYAATIRICEHAVGWILDLKVGQLQVHEKIQTFSMRIEHCPMPKQIKEPSS
jgi:hypothetical protein